DERRVLVVDLTQGEIVSRDDAFAHVRLPPTGPDGARRSAAVGGRGHDGPHRWFIRHRPPPGSLAFADYPVKAGAAWTACAAGVTPSSSGAAASGAGEPKGKVLVTVSLAVSPSTSPKVTWLSSVQLPRNGGSSSATV